MATYDGLSPIIASSFVIGPPQADGRRNVVETHVANDGQSYTYEYLNDGSLDPQTVLSERAAVINATLSAREAARLAVAGTSVPLSRYEFLSRFTVPERLTIRATATTDGVVDDFMKMLELASNVSLVLARPGLDYLVSVGKLTPDRASVIGAD